MLERGAVEGRIWFILHSLRPKPDMVIIPSQHVFHDGIGGRYLEVRTFHNEYDMTAATTTGISRRITSMVFDDISSYSVSPDTTDSEFSRLQKFLRWDVPTEIFVDNPTFYRPHHEHGWLYAKTGILAYLPPGSPDYNFDPIRDAEKLERRRYRKTTWPGLGLPHQPHSTPSSTPES